MTEKDVLLILTFLVASLASWVIWLLFRTYDLKEDLRVSKVILDYARKELVDHKGRLYKIKEALDAD